MTPIRTNFHTHTRRCKHAGGTEEDYVRAALKNGLSRLGLSDHAPYPDVDFGMRMDYRELQEYLDTIDALKAQYHDDITLWKGLEIEYLPAYRNYYEELLTNRGVDYLLLGEHFFYDAAENECNTYRLPSTELYLRYAQTVAEGIRTGLFKAVAHPELFMFNPFAWNDDCRRASDIILDAAVATDTVLEYNANGLRRAQVEFPDGVRHPYPCDRFWELAAKASVRVIVGSDCHDPACLWDEAVTLAYRNLHTLGIEPITELIT